ncbi:hypothetical protein ASPWEDRAFT_29557 [Aspergillus wentii DTO 134E9]|uniref:BTB domain-containing protein n=1 Tax=Aspergillus wentii DTO 134E9 TaxID=1073089 RepID=A0A1L9RHK8_ASPWE|nr:uncharacterized protein ASPWEDRAFT_29557 [Aspergillus wentii DTO 134E9]KAI9925739.1 hypothetical protein MW887_005541 [Aspergillus wentii]OJJ34405.1 hypothetical protein ASPWEDRAFT_29557 [Aspergillus wentii DTO 134E9]
MSKESPETCASVSEATISDHQESCLVKDKTLDLHGETVKVVVKGNQASFFIHENLICARSEFFRKAMSESPTAAQERVINLPKCKPDTFQLYIHWLYTATIPLHSVCTADPAFPYVLLMTEAYVLGEDISDTNFKDTVIYALQHQITRIVASGFDVGELLLKATVKAYGNTPESSPIHRFLIDQYVKQGGAQHSRGPVETDDIPKEFYIDLSVALISTENRKQPKLFVGMCQYHCHGHDEPTKCYRKKLFTSRSPLGLPSAPPKHDFSPDSLAKRRKIGGDS